MRGFCCWRLPCAFRREPGKNAKGRATRGNFPPLLLPPPVPLAAEAALSLSSSLRPRAHLPAQLKPQPLLVVDARQKKHRDNKSFLSSRVAMSRSYNFVSHVEFNHIEEISKLLKACDLRRLHLLFHTCTAYSRQNSQHSVLAHQEGANPDLSHAGVMPLHLAAELARRPGISLRSRELKRTIGLSGHTCLTCVLQIPPRCTSLCAGAHRARRLPHPLGGQPDKAGRQQDGAAGVRAEVAGQREARGQA